MAWLERFASSVRPSAHHLVDVRGQETTMLKEHVRTAEEAVHRRRAAFAELAAEAARSTAERTRALADCERFERDVDLALNGGRRDLARYALRLLLERRQVGERVERRLAEIAREQKELEVVLVRQQGALEELRSRVQSYLSDRELERFAAMGDPVTDEQIELELLRRMDERPLVDTPPPITHDDGGLPVIVTGDA